MLKEGKTIANFCNTIQSITNISQITKEFINYFELFHPITLDQLTILSENIGIELKDDAPYTNARGFHFIHDDKITIYYKKDEATCSQIFTILHELYEILINKINYNNKIDRDKLESDANQFAAITIAPDDKVLNWVNNYSIDIFGFAKNAGCSYKTAQIRINQVLCNLTNKIPPVISLLYERKYWKTKKKCPSLSLNCFSKNKGFQFTLTKTEAKLLYFIVYLPNGVFNIDINKLVRLASKQKANLLLENVSIGLDTTLYLKNADIIIRTEPNKFRYSNKVLIQISPSNNQLLKNLAHKLELTNFYPYTPLGKKLLKLSKKHNITH